MTTINIIHHCQVFETTAGSSRKFSSLVCVHYLLFLIVIDSNIDITLLLAEFPQLLFNVSVSGFLLGDITFQNWYFCGYLVLALILIR